MLDMKNNTNIMVDSAEDLHEQKRIRLQKMIELQQNGEDPFEIVKYDVTKQSSDIHNDFDLLENTEVSVAGRIMTRRIMGQASFCHILDCKGRVQIYIRKEDMGEAAYDKFKRLDIGDIVGIRGTVFRTQAGEASIKANEVTLLAKSLNVLPEKFHGLKDVEARYRQRYVDLIVNSEVRETFIIRTKVIKSIRKFLDEREFMEVETPVLETISGGAAARPFITHHNALDIEMFLRIAHELPLKKLIVGGFERVYQLAKVFRNEGIDSSHNPEFTMLELYQAYIDYHGIMELTEDLFRAVALETTDKLQFDFMGHIIDLSKRFERISMVDAVKKYAGVDFSEVKTLDEARALAKKVNVHYDKKDEKGNILNNIFEEYAEKKLVQPTFLIDHPIEISPLTKKKPGNPDYVERFEVFIAGKEFANAYSELNDPVDQRKRFEHQEKLRAGGNEEANRIDEEFLDAMEYGMPPTGGLGVGVERFIMLLTGANSIRDVILFPTMRPE